MLPAVGPLPDSCDVLASGCLQLPNAIEPAFQGAVGGYLRVPVRLSQCNQLPGGEKQGTTNAGATPIVLNSGFPVIVHAHFKIGPVHACAQRPRLAGVACWARPRRWYSGRVVTVRSHGRLTCNEEGGGDPRRDSVRPRWS
jgi:hypothetical protein